MTSLWWDFLDSTPVIEISIRNPLLGQSFPSRIAKSWQEERQSPANRGIMAILDTGYDGFLVLPERLFRKLAFHRLNTQRFNATLANGKAIELIGAFGSLAFPSLDNLVINGRIETGKGQSEVLIGMDGIRSLLIELDSCKKALRAEKCST